MCLGIDETNAAERPPPRKICKADIWNPLLIAIGAKRVNIVKLLFHQVPCFHRLNCLAKPYSLEDQKKLVFDHSKRLKRECFGLKLAILNEDEEMLKFLWNDLRIYWNLGHFYVSLKAILKREWDMGLKILLASTTSKVIFMSINTSSADFADVIDML
jgi:hypothetical protein